MFPGQGSQRVGMAEALRAAEPELFDELFEAAEAAARLPLRRYVAVGPAEQLTRTEIAQPLLFATSLGLAEVARRSGLRPAAVAGHSLGEYTAAVAAGALSFEDGQIGRASCRERV